MDLGKPLAGERRYLRCSARAYDPRVSGVDSVHIPCSWLCTKSHPCCTLSPRCRTACCIRHGSRETPVDVIIQGSFSAQHVISCRPVDSFGRDSHGPAERAMLKLSPLVLKRRCEFCFSALLEFLTPFCHRNSCIGRNEVYRDPS